MHKPWTFRVIFMKMLENLLMLQKPEFFYIKRCFFCLMASQLFVAAAFGLDGGNLLSTWRDYRVSIPIAVSWEVTRPQFANDYMISQSETFHEIWHLQLRKGVGIRLRSPRLEVPVYLTKGIEQLQSKHIIMGKRDFASLLGIPNGIVKRNEDNIFHQVILSIASKTMVKHDLELVFETGESYFVHLELGNDI